MQIVEKIVTELLSNFRVVRYNRLAYFSRAGELNDKLGFVIDGVFYMQVIQEDGTLHVKNFIGKDEFILATYDPQKESLVNVLAIKDAVILEAKYSKIWNLLSRYPDVNLLAQKGMERRIEGLYERLESFATLEAKNRYQRFKQEYGSLENEIPQYLIASYLGITPTQLSRIRNQMPD
jgi:CRP-like cAMP-binding protein